MNVSDKIDFEVGMRLIDAARDGNVSVVGQIATSSHSINFHDPKTGRAAIHEIADSGSRRLLKAFLKADGINYLAKDNNGQLASDIAQVGNRDRVIQRFLRMGQTELFANLSILIEQVESGDIILSPEAEEEIGVA